jgi:predicted Zn-dependent protease
MTAAAPSVLDIPRLVRWIEPFGREGLADLFFEWKSELLLTFENGELQSAFSASESGAAARARKDDRILLSAVPRADEAGAREAIRRLAGHLGSEIYPKDAEAEEEEIPSDSRGGDRFARKVASLLAHALPEHSHRLEARRLRARRLVVPAELPSFDFERVRLSVQGKIQADTPAGPRWRAFSFHFPESDDGSLDELRQRLRTVISPGLSPVAPTGGTVDVLLDFGSAAFFFHETLSHPLEADVPVSRLGGLSKARLAHREIDVADEPSRLDLFGGYPADDEGVPAKRTPLLNAGHLAGSLRDRQRSDRLHPPTGNGRRPGVFDHAAPRGSNIVVAPGGASDEEMLHRLGNGLRIEEFEGATVDVASGKFRLRFSAAQAVHRGRVTGGVGPGIIEGEILEAMDQIDSLLGSRARPCRQLAWCAREGKAVPIGGEAPALIVRGLQVKTR